MTRKVQIVMLTQDSRPFDAVKDCIIQVVTQLSKRDGYTVVMSARRGSSMIPHARNAAVSEFMASGGDDLIFIDADNYCDPAAMIRLLDWPVDIVGIPCRAKQDEMKWPVRFLNDVPMAPIDPITLQSRADGLMRVESIGTGIMRITRRCFEKMIDDRWYYDDTSKAGKSWPFFEYVIDGHNFWGEDVWFCMKWRKLGGEVWIDPHTESFHIGLKEYSGSVAHWLANGTSRMEIKNLVDNGFHSSRIEKSSSAANHFHPHTQRQKFIDEIAADMVDAAEKEELAA